jgi:hypothetical protein
MANSIEFHSKEDENTFVERVSVNTKDYLDSLQTPNEIEQIILKTHLCSERLLEEIITISLPNPGAVLSARYTFANKLALVKAIAGLDNNRLEIISKIDVLNKIRNQMAHQIDSSKIASLFKKLCIEYPESTELDYGSVQNIKTQIAEIFGGLIALKEMVTLESQGIDYSVRKL